MLIRSDHYLFKTFQWILIVLRIKSKIFIMASKTLYDLDSACISFSSHFASFPTTLAITSILSVPLMPCSLLYASAHTLLRLLLRHRQMHSFSLLIPIHPSSTGINRTSSVKCLDPTDYVKSSCQILPQHT